MKLYQYNNGNATVNIFEDGTREIEFEGSLDLDYPLNLDIRVSSSCSFANSLCKDFCHESALVNGKDVNYEKLKSKLIGLPKGIELAIGCNHLNDELVKFLCWVKSQDYIANLTINQGHIIRDSINLILALQFDLIKGLGISYRKELKWNVPEFLLNYSNLVFHVIVGIDSIEDVKLLKEKEVKKITVLGEKDFGYNKNKLKNHKDWIIYIRQLFDLFEVVAFDNLALEQLKVRRFFQEDDWNKFYQFENSFYIDGVNEVFKPSSRSNDERDWDINIKDYFKHLKKSYEYKNK